MTTVKSTTVAAAALDELPPAVVSETPAPAFEEPAAGGNYVRDPVTGALSLNPAHLPKTPPSE